MTRRTDFATAGKVHAALAARAAFGDRHAYQTARIAGLALGLVMAVFSRPLHQTRERALELNLATERRSETR